MREEIKQEEFDLIAASLKNNLVELHKLVKLNPAKFVKQYAPENGDPILMSKNENMFWGILVSKENTENTRALLGQHHEAIVAWMLESSREVFEALVNPVIEKVRRNYPALKVFVPYYEDGEWIEDNPIISVEFPYYLNTQVPDTHMATQLIRGMMMLEDGILDAMEQA